MNINDAVFELDLPPLQVLICASTGSWFKVKDLAAKFNVSVNTLYRALAELERDNYIIAAVNGDKRRLEPGPRLQFKPHNILASRPKPARL